MDPIWNDYDKLSVILDKLLVEFLSYLNDGGSLGWSESLSSHFVGPKAMGF